MAARNYPYVAHVVREQVRATRKRKGWSQAALGQRLKEIGAELDQHAVASLESGRRGVYVDDLLELAAALDVAPVHLLAPFDDDDEVKVAAVSVKAPKLRAWIRGLATLAGPTQSERDYFEAVPDSEWAGRQDVETMLDTALMSSAMKEASGELTPDQKAAMDDLDLFKLIVWRVRNPGVPLPIQAPFPDLRDIPPPGWDPAFGDPPEDEAGDEDGDG